MPDKPIIFSGAMVRANLEGRKRQTRRITSLKGLKWAKGDRLWVRETCRAEELETGQDGVLYAADSAFIPIEETKQAGQEWLKLASYRQGGTRRLLPLPVPSIHMPRWCSRLTLLVTDVRVERLQDITEIDAIDEGALTIDLPTHGAPTERGKPPLGQSPRDRFAHLWKTINRPESWDANPWVAVISYDLVKQNIDRISA